MVAPAGDVGDDTTQKQEAWVGGDGGGTGGKDFGSGGDGGGLTPAQIAALIGAGGAALGGLGGAIAGVVRAANGEPQTVNYQQAAPPQAAPPQAAPPQQYQPVAQPPVGIAPFRPTVLRSTVNRDTAAANNTNNTNNTDTTPWNFDKVVTAIEKHPAATAAGVIGVGAAAFFGVRAMSNKGRRSRR